MKNNNIFEFATKELSLDAFICWCINWLNYPQDDLYSLALELFGLFGVDASKENKIEIKQQFKKVDILAILPAANKIIIIEDKTFSSEHDEQIRRYKEEIQNIGSTILDSITADDILTVYFKIGFFYDSDRYVRDRVADKSVDAEMFLHLLKKYMGKSEILDDYVDYLERLCEWYVTYGDFCGKDEEKGRYISSEYIAQYKFMKYVFANRVWDMETSKYRIKSGTNQGGRPWTEMNIIVDRHFRDSTDTYHVFWRVDTDKNGIYLSFRFYEWMDKKNAIVVKRHREEYIRLKGILENIVRSGEYIFTWESISEKDKGKYNEASFLRIGLEEYLDKWEELGKEFSRNINEVTDKFFLNEID